MTPSECRPGTVVIYRGHAGVVAGEPFDGEPSDRGPLVRIEMYDGFGPVRCHELRLAPCYFINGNWCVRDEFNKSQAHIWHDNGWRISPTTDGSFFPTYLAARQAVERACGVAVKS